MKHGVKFVIGGVVAALGAAGFVRFVSRRMLRYVDPLTLIQDLPQPLTEIALEGGFNFRDLGGYPTADGRQIRRGMLYRSGSLGSLTERDWETLGALGLRLVCDLRSVREKSAEPDRLPEHDAPEYLHLPFHHLETDDKRQIFAVLFNPRALASTLTDTYTRLMLDENAAIFGEIFRRMADPDMLPMVFHCTAGKDRTGVTSALILLALGVPEHIVIADYTQSNRAYPHYVKYAESAIQQAAFLGVRVTDLHPLLLADGQTMQAVITHLQERYGGVAGYLIKAAGIAPETLARLRETLLTPQEKN